MPNREHPLGYSGAQPPYEDEFDETDLPIRNRSRAERRSKSLKKLAEPEREPARRLRKPDGSETFRCRHCRNMVGPTLSGGRHRNHCPICLYSLHVDGKTPGDRASECRSLMAPIGLYTRPGGEQAIVHRCLGCGFVRHNRVAADDSPFVLEQLEEIDLPDASDGDFGE
jgi:hypothetical protein